MKPIQSLSVFCVSLDVCVGLHVGCLHVGKSVRCAWGGWCVLSRCCVCVRSLSSVELCDALSLGRWPGVFIS